MLAVATAVLAVGAGIVLAPKSWADDAPAGDPPLATYEPYDLDPGGGESVTSTLAAPPTTSIPCDNNGADDSSTRHQIITRARTWLSVGIPYSQSRCYKNAYGDYRTDCSGFVSMAWGVGGVGSVPWTGNLGNWSHVIARGDLKPGDALLRYAGDPSLNHVALFVAWSDSDHTKPYVYEQKGSTGTTAGTWSASYAAKYTPVRYDHVVEDQPAPPAPHGSIWDRGRNTAAKWDVNSTTADKNPASIATASTALPDGRQLIATTIPGSGTYVRTRAADGTWAATSQRIDTNGAVTDVAMSTLPDGTVEMSVLVPGAGVYSRTRKTDGTWDASTEKTNNNGTVTAISSAALPNGEFHLQVLVPKNGVYDRKRSAAGAWDASTVKMDNNPLTTDIAAAGMPDGTLEVQMGIPGSGIWSRKRGTDGAWATGSVHADVNPNTIGVSAAAGPDGTLYISTLIKGSGVYVRSRTTGGVWAQTSTRADSNPTTWRTYLVAMPNGTLHTGQLVNLA